MPIEASLAGKKTIYIITISKMTQLKNHMP